MPRRNSKSNLLRVEQGEIQFCQERNFDYTFSVRGGKEVKGQTKILVKGKYPCIGLSEAEIVGTVLLP